MANEPTGDTQKPEGEQAPESPTGEQTPEGKEEKGGVPYSRFNEVNEGLKTSQTEIESLKQEMEALKAQQPVEEEQEPSTWKEVKERAVKESVGKMREELKKEAEKEFALEREIDRRFEQLEEIGETVSPEIRNSVMKKMIEKGSNDVFETYLKYKEDFQKQTRVEQQKQEGFVPSSSRGGEPKVPSFSYKEIKGKSLDEIIEEGT